MTETREYVVIRTYTVADLIALLGEGKKDVKVKINLPRNGPKPIWSWTSQTDAEILQVEIREPVK